VLVVRHTAVSATAAAAASMDFLVMVLSPILSPASDHRRRIGTSL
jgi:hypothetical protein